MNTVDFSSNVFTRAQNQSTIPGLWPESVIPVSIDGDAPQFAQHNVRFGLEALSDLAYEYLVKTHLLLGKTRRIYESMWRLAVRQLKRYVLFRGYILHANVMDVIFPGGLPPGTHRATRPCLRRGQNTWRVFRAAYLPWHHASSTLPTTLRLANKSPTAVSGPI